VIPAVVAVLVGFFQFVLPVIMSSKPTTIDFVGVVRNAAGKGIRGAKVSLEGKDVPPVQYTDSEGVFSFRTTRDLHRIKIRVDAEGYVSDDRNITLNSNPDLAEIRLQQLNGPTPSPTITPDAEKDHGSSTKPPQAKPQPTESLAARQRSARKLLNSSSSTPTP
jgi:hypothetical protein